VDEVRQRWAQAAEQARDGNRHAQLLRAGGKAHGLDSVRDERRIARDRGDPKIVGNLRQRPQQLRNVRLVAGATAAEYVRIDEDERLRYYAASR
jgi:hypothetical protein